MLLPLQVFVPAISDISGIQIWNTSTLAFPATGLPGAFDAPTDGTMAASSCNSPASVPAHLLQSLLLYDFVNIRMLCASFVEWESRATTGSFSVSSLKELWRKKARWLPASFWIWVLLQSAVRKDECSVCAHIAVRHYHDEECRYQLGSRLRLQDLKAWP